MGSAMSRATEEIRELSRLTKDEWREYTKTVWHIANVTDSEHPAVFPAEIPRRLIKMFSFVGETVLDPFAGIGTTGFAALELKRRAICVEQNEAFAARISQQTETSASIQVVVGDSRNMAFLTDDSVDLIVTSPPYWNKADYGGNGSNLGNVSGYRQFFRAVRPSFEECLRVLQPGRKLCVVTANVNQHTEFGLLTFPLPADLTLLLRDIGFLPIADVIWSKDGTGGRWGSWGAQRPIFGSYPYPPNFLFKTVHEHVLIFAKQPERMTRGPKVVSYRSLMELSP
jgi:DNA modification methylase